MTAISATTRALPGQGAALFQPPHKTQVGGFPLAITPPESVLRMPSSASL
jgi:hypothetical protein